MHLVPTVLAWAPDAGVALRDGAVHVWHVALGDGASEEAAAVLDAEEHARAARFVHDADRARWVVARVALRGILAGYLGRAAASLAFAAEPLGRPRLATPAGALAFSLSHSRCCALVAVTTGAAVGVDVECAGAVPDALAIARDAFEAHEARALASIADPATRDAAFRRAWCGKEAWLKAHGVGLSVPLAHVPVHDDGAGGSRLADIDAARAAGAWTGAQLALPATGCHGALVVAGRGMAISGYRWPPHA